MSPFKSLNNLRYVSLYLNMEVDFEGLTLVLVVDDHSSSFRRLAALITTVDDFSLASTYYF